MVRDDAGEVVVASRPYQSRQQRTRLRREELVVEAERAGRETDDGDSLVRELLDPLIPREPMVQCSLDGW